MEHHSIIKVKTLRRIGFLWHFGHFFHDFLMPMNDYLATLRPDPSHSVGVILFGAAQGPAGFKGQIPGMIKRDDFLGSFINFAEKFLNIKVRYEYGPAFEKVPRKLVRIKSYSFGPYKPESFDRLVSRADSLYGSLIRRKYPPVILIERGHAPLEASRSGHQWIKTGSSIRNLSNHSEIKDAMLEKYKDDFMNVVLEDLSFEDQISLFKHAKIVVGQHGAGLCNIAWMTQNNSTVVELPPVRFPTFRHMCRAKNIDYKVIFRRWIREAPASTYVDASQVIDLLPNIQTYGLV